MPFYLELAHFLDVIFGPYFPRLLCCLVSSDFLLLGSILFTYIFLVNSVFHCDFYSLLIKNYTAGLPWWRSG